MAKCPECKNKLPFFRVGNLSFHDNGLRCPGCDVYLETDRKHLLRISGVLGTVFFGNSINKRIASNIYDGELALLILLTLLYLFLILYVKNQTVVFKKCTEPEDYWTSQEPVEVDVPNKVDEPKKYLEYEFRNHSERKLNEIVESGSYRKEAVEVAKKMLEEKYSK